MKNRGKILACVCAAAMMGAALTVSAAARANTETSAGIFSDVSTNAWYHEYVQYVYEHGLMTGMGGSDQFQPEAKITKAQVAQVLYNKEEKPKITDKTVFTKLKDVSANAWYAEAVAWAYGNGIITGDISTMTFSPNADVTREQLSLMLYRYSTYKKYDVSKSGQLTGMEHADKVSSWAETSVKWAVGTTLISGLKTDKGYDLAPQGSATRAQMATILERYCEDYVNASNDTPSDKDDGSDEGDWTPYL